MSSEQHFYRALGDKIRSRRCELGISQDTLARALRPPLARSAIANIEAGEQRILVIHLVRVAAVLQVEVAGLLPDAPPEPHDLRQELAAKLDISGAALDGIIEAIRQATS